MSETWLPVAGFGGYEVSSLGRVRSWKRRGPPVLLKQSRIKSKKLVYRAVCLQGDDGRQENQLVHRLVAQAFIPNPEGKPQVAHKNGDTSCNPESNLKWATQLENEEDKREHGTWGKKLTITQALEIRRWYACGGVPYRKIAHYYGISIGTVGSIVRNEIWKVAA